MHLYLTLVFLVSSNTDLKNVAPLFHTGRACFMLFLMGSLPIAFAFLPAIYHVSPTPDAVYLSFQSGSCYSANVQ